MAITQTGEKRRVHTTQSLGKDGVPLFIHPSLSAAGSGRVAGGADASDAAPATVAPSGSLRLPRRRPNGLQTRHAQLIQQKHQDSCSKPTPSVATFIHVVGNEKEGRETGQGQQTQEALEFQEQAGKQKGNTNPFHVPCRRSPAPETPAVPAAPLPARRHAFLPPPG